MEKTIRLRVECGELASKLAKVTRIVSNKNTMPILGNVVLQKGEGQNDYYLIGSDGEHWIRQRIKMDTIQDGLTSLAICRVADLQKAISGLASDQPIILEIDTDTNSLQVSYMVNRRSTDEKEEQGAMSGGFTIPVTGTEDYPMPPAIAQDENYTACNIGGDWLTTAIKAASVCLAKDEIRLSMNCVCLDVDMEGITVVGSDGHKLYKRRYEAGVGGSEPFFKGTPRQMLVHSRILPTLDQALRGEENVLVESDGTRTRFTRQKDGVLDVELVCAMVEQRFPNYNAVIPKDNDKKMTVCVRDLTQALKRVALFASESTDLIEFACCGDKTELRAQDIDNAANAYETVAIVGESSCPEGFKIGLKSAALLSLLPNVLTENVVFTFSSHDRAVLILEEDIHSMQTMLIMPMLLENNV